MAPSDPHSVQPFDGKPAAAKVKRGSAAYARARQKIGSFPALSPEANSPFAMAYLRFLYRVAQSEEREPIPDAQLLDTNEKAMLELALLRWAQGDPLTVRQAIGHAHLGSPATLHRRLMQLRQKNYLQLEDVAGDKRAKYLVPGPHGLAHLESMGRHMMGARRNPLTPLGKG